MKTGIFRSWDTLPGELCGRWVQIRPFVLECFNKGMAIEILSEQITDVSDAGYPWGGKAIYLRLEKKLIMTADIATGTATEYGTFRGDVHEVGHAVRFLLIRGIPFWKLSLWHKLAIKEKRLLDEYSQTFEEWWAQGWEAFWTKDRMDGTIDHNRDELKQKEPALYAFIEAFAKARAENIDPF